MKKKCYLSLLLVLSMLIPTVMPVSAAVADAQILSGYTITGWSELVNPSNNGIVVGPTDFDAKTGDYSLCGIFPTKNLSSNENGVYINNTEQTVTLTAGTAYTYGVWVKADVNVFRIWPYLWVGSYEEKYELQKQSTVVDGWTKYEKTFTPTSNVTGKLRLGFHSNLSGYKDSYNSITVLLDDAYMYASGSDVNLVDNPSFDAQEAQQQDDPPEPPAQIDLDSAQILFDYKVAGWSELLHTQDKGVRVGPTDHSRTGNFSLCVIFPTIKTYQHDYIENTLQTVTVTAGTTYTFGVWLKYKEGVSPRKTWPYICVGSYVEGWDLEPGEKADGWQHYTKTFTPEVTATGNLKFGFQSDMSAYKDSYETIKVLFDDAYMYASGSDENLVDNPSFEAELDDTADFKIYEPKLYKGNNEVLNIGSGNYFVRTKIRNNKLDTPVPITQIIALYKGDILKKVVSTSTLAEKLEATEPSAIIEGNIEVPDTDHHIEVFIWDSKNEMKSLYDFVTFNSGE